MFHSVIFIGRSGCGKGTQATLFQDWVKKSDTYPFLYIETGAHFRKFINENGYSSALSHQIMDDGGRQPDFLAVWVWANELVNNLKSEMHLVFDGVPRAELEAKVLAGAMKFYKREKPTVVYLRVSRDWSKNHLLKRARFDDNEEDINTRLNWFDSDVMPAVEYFKNNPDFHFIEVDGEQEAEKVHEDIVARYGNAS